MVKNTFRTLISTFQKTSQLPSLSPQKNPDPNWFIWLLLITCLVIPPTAVAAFTPNSVFFFVKAWGLEYQFQKGEIELPKQK